jgi:MraZ protein
LPFTGTYDHSLDVKNRLTIPAKARAALADGVTIVMSADQCLQLWPSEAYNAAANQALEGVSPFSQQGRTLRQYFFGQAVQTEMDKAGRVGLPAHVLSHAGIEKAATVVGSGDWLDVWAPERHSASTADLIAKAAEFFDGHPA